MSIYTKAGDIGITSLAKIPNVSKYDDRIQLLGSMDELSSSLGLVKASETMDDIRTELERIQKNLMIIMSGIADSYNKEYKLREVETTHLEEEIDRMEAAIPEIEGFVLPGGCRHSAQIDMSRSIARRAERFLVPVDRKFTVDSGAKKYLNRLADYLYMLARYTDFMQANKQKQTIHIPSGENKDMDQADIVKSVIEKLGLRPLKINLDTAKKLIASIEEEAARLGMNVVIAICSPEGSPVAVHVMDGAYLASFDIAIKKAYTSVALKMSTQELGELAKPGGSLYGIDKADEGRLIIFGGGIPLTQNGSIIGGLGISGGTSEQDAKLAEYGASALIEIQ